MGGTWVGRNGEPRQGPPLATGFRAGPQQARSALHVWEGPRLHVCALWTLLPGGELLCALPYLGPECHNVVGCPRASLTGCADNQMR